MRLNAFTDVCLRVLMHLGRHPEERLTGQQIADGIGVPYNHVAKAIAELRRRETIDVTRGRFGGAMITDQGLETSLGTLVRGLSTRPEILDCTGTESGRACPMIAGCRLRVTLAQALEAFYAHLDPITVRDIVAQDPTAGAQVLQLIAPPHRQA